MIINCESKRIVNEKIMFELPQIYLDLDFQHVITILDFYVKWKNPPGEKLFTLRTNMIGRSPGNPKQDLIRFSTKNNQLSAHFQPTHLTPYILKFLDIEGAVFHLHSYTSATPENIEFIALQIEIV